RTAAPPSAGSTRARRPAWAGRPRRVRRARGRMGARHRFALRSRRRSCPWREARNARPPPRSPRERSSRKRCAGRTWPRRDGRERSRRRPLCRSRKDAPRGGPSSGRRLLGGRRGVAAATLGDDDAALHPLAQGLELGERVIQLSQVHALDIGVRRECDRDAHEREVLELVAAVAYAHEALLAIFFLVELGHLTL